MTVPELRALCKKKGISGYSKLTKATLVKKCTGKAPKKTSAKKTSRKVIKKKPRKAVKKSSRGGKYKKLEFDHIMASDEEDYEEQCFTCGTDNDM